MTRRALAACFLAACSGGAGAPEPDAMPPPPPCQLLEVLAATPDGPNHWHVDQPLLMRRIGEGAVTSAILRLDADGGEPVDLDVTADVADFLDGRAPNEGWQVEVAAQTAALSVCFTPGPAPDFLDVAPDGWNFRGRTTGNPFVPVGVNYDHDSSGTCPRLLEEYWHDEWDRVEEDLAEIRALGMNAVRIHIQYDEFMLGPDEPNEANLIKLDQLVRAARRHGLVIDLTGLNMWRRERIPTWYAELDDDAAMDSEAAFWTAVATRYREEDTIFTYDLQNEPFVVTGDTDAVVSDPFSLCDPDGAGPAPATGYSFVHNHFRHAGPRWTTWVQAKYGTEAALMAAWPDYPRPDESWAAIGRPQFFSSSERLRDDRAFRHDLAALWTARMAEAVRAVDPNHLVTLGMTMGSLPLQDHHAVDAGEWLIYSSFSPYHLADSLDVISLHVYPQRYGTETNVDLCDMVLRAGHVGRPVILEETFRTIDNDDFDGFLDRTLGAVSGWYSFYWGLTSDELRVHPDQPWGSIVAGWLDRYAAFVSTVDPNGVTRSAPTVTVPVSIDAQLDSPAARATLADDFSAAVSSGMIMDPVLEP